MATQEIFGSIEIRRSDVEPPHKSSKGECIQNPALLRALMKLYDGGRVCGPFHRSSARPTPIHSPVKTRDHSDVSISSPSISRHPQQGRYAAQGVSLKYPLLEGREYMSKSPEPYSSGTSSGKSSPHSTYGSLTFSSPTSSLTQSPLTSQSSLADLTTSSPPPFIRQQPRIRIDSLLSDPQFRSYHLEIVQQPLRTAEFGAALLSRTPITPPIIARLTVRDYSGNPIIPEPELPFLLAHLTLFSDDGLTPLDTGSYIGRGGQQNPPMLYGSLVSTVEKFEDLQGNMGLFFLFPDVSIHRRGRYQLGVNLFRIGNPQTTSLSEQGTFLAQTRTRPFDVVPLPEYVAAPTTRLTQSFIRQGARLFPNSPPHPSF
ncbi:hypothetical protein CPC08DRAFT_705436 [Agrocybe pediades]|nr:hypothetical protein CPC08DRAFT_705436 [Agrocybe pediades]